jgi:AraC-like DNA-binding protein
VLVGCDGSEAYGHSFLIEPEAVATIAAKTLLDRGFRNIAFAGALAMGESQRRYDHFRRKLETHGVNPLLFTSHAVPGQTSGQVHRKRHRPGPGSPVGWKVWKNPWAFLPRMTAWRLRFTVPARGWGSAYRKKSLCWESMTTPCCAGSPIPTLQASDCRMNAWVMMPPAPLRKLIRNGDIIQKSPMVYEPVGLIVRESIKQVVVQDPVVRDALIYIQENCMRPVNVEDMLGALQVSRSLLERRFRDAIGVTPLVELRRQRIELARALLSDTQEPIQDLGARCGFSSAIRFTTVFKEQVGMTPSDFRKQMIPGSLN